MFEYIKKNEEITITAFDDESSAEVVIPSIIDGCKVRKICGEVFSSNKNLKSVVVEEGIEEIEKACFLNAENLEYIKLPSTLKIIGKEAFSWCNKLKKVEFAEIAAFGLTIGECAFYFCSALEEVGFPEGTKVLERRAFSVCGKLKKVFIPSSMQSIGVQCFESCGSLKEVFIKEGIQTIESWAFRECKGLCSIDLPKTLTQIGEGAFIGCLELKNIFIPQGVKEISDWCFGKCRSLEIVEIPDGVVSIGSFSFGRCRKLREVYLPKSIKVVKRGSFSYCLEMEKVCFPYGLSTVEERVFEMCSSLRWVSMPETVQNFSIEMFYECKSLLGIEYELKNQEVNFLYIPPVAEAVEFVKNISKKPVSWCFYDSLFHQLEEETYKTQMAIYRIKNPVGLNEETRSVYVSYIKERARELVLQAIEEDSIEEIGFYGDNLFIDSKHISEYIEASSKRQGSITGYLLNYNRNNFGDIQKRFTL